MLSEFPIEQESIELFRRSLQLTEDPVNIRVGELGDIVFLDTKTFDAWYMDYCDNYIGQTLRYSLESRNEMQMRRAAIFPYLGKQLLHGGIKHDGIFLNVFILKSTGQVICCERSELSKQ